MSCAALTSEIWRALNVLTTSSPSPLYSVDQVPSPSNPPSHNDQTQGLLIQRQSSVPCLPVRLLNKPISSFHRNKALPQPLTTTNYVSLHPCSFILFTSEILQIMHSVLLPQAVNIWLINCCDLSYPALGVVCSTILVILGRESIPYQWSEEEVSKANFGEYYYPTE